MTEMGESPSVEPSDPLDGRRPWIRVEGAQITRDGSTDGGYRVIIVGHNLKMAISPPRIRVGGLDLTQVSFDPAGKQITGTLLGEPRSDEVSVDYGFASGGTRLDRHEGPAT